MPWSTPTLSDVRGLVRDSVRAKLPGSDATVPNSVLRVVSDVQGGLCHLTLQYVDWLALQLLPDTAETEWLDRHAQIWLVNADGTVGRKQPTPAQGTVTVTGIQGTLVPTASDLTSSNGVTYETTQQITIGVAATSVTVQAVDYGSQGNQLAGAILSFSPAVAGADQAATVVELASGTDQETDDELRARVLDRIREPPMGGDADDYVQWALAVPGVTRAWSFPQEMGIGTMTVRFMMDDLRASNGGFPLPADADTVKTYLDTVRPVTVKDLFVEPPIPFPVNVRITWLNPDTAATHAAIEQSLLETFAAKAIPGQTWYRAWTDEAVMAAAGVIAYDLSTAAVDAVMPGNGYMPVLGDITYG
jgi:uncharacterized phage protein gp47/JayE